MAMIGRGRWRGRMCAAVSAAMVLAGLASAAEHPTPPAAPSGEALAMVLRDNVVTIVAKWQDGASHNGFGFIVGARGERVFIVTADHILRGRNPGEIAAEIRIEPFQRQGTSFMAELIGTRDPALDLAVLQATLPPDLGWYGPVLSDPGGLERGTPVWFVGRSGKWYVPTRPGSINDIDRRSHRIMVDDLNVQVGTSGAPLIAESGVVGMIVADEAGGVSRATAIDAIESALREWNHPWQLVALPPPGQTTAEPAAPDLETGEPSADLPPPTLPDLSSSKRPDSWEAPPSDNLMFAPDAIPNIAAPPSGAGSVDIGGAWSATVAGVDGLGVFTFNPLGGGRYEFAELNLLGQVVGGGTANVTGDRVALSGTNFVASAVYSADLQLLGSQMTGTVVDLTGQVLPIVLDFAGPVPPMGLAP